MNWTTLLHKKTLEVSKLKDGGKNLKGKDENLCVNKCFDVNIGKFTGSLVERVTLMI